MAGLRPQKGRSVMSHSTVGTGKGTAQPVYFTAEQYAWLDTTFPELRITPTTTMEEIQNVGGKRELIAAIRARVRNLSVVQL